MKDAINKKVIIGVLVVVLVTVGFLIFNREMELNGSGSDYSKVLWERISTGASTATECQKAAEKYKADNPYSWSGRNTVSSFYSYKKQRCFGLEEQYWDKSADMQKGHEDRIFDLITGNTIVSCRVFDTPSIQVYCSDNQNSWMNDKGVLPPPYPIFLNTWQGLKALGGE